MEIPLGVLRATQCCDPEFTGHALNAIQIRRLGDGRLQAATTNGRTLAIVRWHDDAACSDEPLPLLIPLAAAETIAQGNVAKHNDADAALEQANNGQLSLTIRRGNRAERVDFDPADGRFPDVAQVIPTPTLARSVFFDARLLRDLLSAFIDASGIADDSPVCVTFTFDAASSGESDWEAASKPAVLTRKREGEPELLGAIMPMVKE